MSDILKDTSTKTQILNGINKYTPLLKENLKNTFVTLEGGKVLSDNNFSNADKQKLDDIDTSQFVTVQAGKVLSDNNFSNADKQKLDDIDTSQFVTVQAGKVLSDNNFSNADKQKLDGIDTSQFVTIQAGKVLSDNNFSNADKQKLDGIDSGANVNVIEGVAVNGQQVNPTAFKIVDLTIPEGLKSVSITGGSATLQNGNLNIEIDSQTECNFTATEKLKLQSVENNAQQNVIEKIYLNGSELAIDEKAVSISAGSGAFTINGAQVDNVTITGADFSTEGSNATLSVAEDNFVTVNGALVEAISITGAATVGIDTATKLANIFVGGQKQSANLTLSTQNLVFNDLQPQTLSATHLGDGILSLESFNLDDVVEIVKVGNSAWEITPFNTGIGEGNISLSETEQYYGAQKNFNISNVFTPPTLIMHFNDDLSSNWEVSTEATRTVAFADGVFGKALNINDAGQIVTISPTNFQLGGRNFTIDFRTKVYDGASATVSRTFHLPALDGWGTINDGTDCPASLIVTSRHYKNIIFPDDSRWEDTEYDDASGWKHIAFCYNHYQQKLTAFVNGIKVLESENITLPRVTLPNFVFGKQWGGGGYSYVDEFRIVDGIAYWSKNFTPPDQPY